MVIPVPTVPLTVNPKLAVVPAALLELLTAAVVTRSAPETY